MALVMATAMVASTLTSFGTTNIARAKSPDAMGKAIAQMKQLSNGKLTYLVSQNNGQQTILSGRLSEKKAASAEEALNFVEANKEVFGLSDAKGSLQVASTQKDELGFTHVKFNQVVNGIPVEGRELAVHFDNNGYVVNATGNVEIALNITKNGSKNLSAADAVSAAKNGFANKNLKAEPKADKVILVQNDQAFEVYKVNVQYSNPIANYDVYVDVTTGDILNISDNIRYDGAVVGSGKLVNGQTKALNLYLAGSTYQMKDVTKPMTGTIQTYTANQTTAEPGTLMTGTSATMTDTAANSAHYYGGLVYDFYKNVFNRDSIDNAGMTLNATVHYDRNYNNAFWDGNQMVYGDGDGSTFTYLSGDLDVVGHEMTHGITERSAGLTYSDQSGALNESMSDVMGVLIETYDKYDVKNGGTWTFNAADWVVGDDVYTPGTPGDALRSLADPTIYGDPANMSGYVYTSSDNGGVHTNSGIPNHAGFLVAQSLGNEKTARIYYRGLTSYLLRNSDFTAARVAMIQAATDLYGSSSAEVTAVTNAFNSVGISTVIADTYESNNTTGTAYQITSGTTYKSLISSTTDVDYYKIVKSARGTISISLTTLPGDYDMYLYNSSGQLVAKSELAYGSNESISYRTSGSGTYYLKIVGYDGANSQGSQYTLKATY